MKVEELDFDKMDGVVIVVVQHYLSKAVLIVGVMTLEALKKTLETGQVTFWSRVREELWTKGKLSGNMLFVRSVVADCDADTLLITADPVGPVCHTGAWNCFSDKNGLIRELSL